MHSVFQHRLDKIWFQQMVTLGEIMYSEYLRPVWAYLLCTSKYLTSENEELSVEIVSAGTPDCTGAPYRHCCLITMYKWTFSLSCKRLQVISNAPSNTSTLNTQDAEVFPVPAVHVMR